MDLNCPYCGTELEVNHDDGHGYEEDVKHQMECGDCEKSFVFLTSISYYYEAEKADCLNGDPHKWKAQTVFPKECTQMECEHCDETRRPTDEEMKSILS
jgi:hypothetical protein